MRAPTAVEPDLSSPEATLGQQRIKTGTYTGHKIQENWPVNAFCFQSCH